MNRADYRRKTPRRVTVLLELETDAHLRELEEPDFYTLDVKSRPAKVRNVAIKRVTEQHARD